MFEITTIDAGTAAPARSFPRAQASASGALSIQAPRSRVVYD